MILLVAGALPATGTPCASIPAAKLLISGYMTLPSALDDCVGDPSDTNVIDAKQCVLLRKVAQTEDLIGL